MSPWEDISSTAIVAGLSVLIAFNAFRQGRASYRLHLYLTVGNFVISVLAYIGNTDGEWPSLLELVYFLLVAAGAFFLTLGVLEVFGAPKRVQCFRCDYVDIPRETEAPPTPFDNTERNAFQKLHWEGHRRRNEDAEQA